MNGVSRTREKNENDILLSLEESVDWHNQTSGFVSSYTLPMPISSSFTTTATDDINDGDTTVSAISLSTPIALTRVNHSLESAMSCKTDDSEHDDDGHLENGIRDIFRPPSRSPSQSPKSRICSPPLSSIETNNNNLSGSTVYSPTPTERSIASDSTDAASNIRLPSTNLHPRTSSSNTNRLPGGLKYLATPTATAAAAAARNVIAGKSSNSRSMVGNVIRANKNAREMAGVSPLRSSPRVSPKKSMYVDNHITQKQHGNEKDAAAMNSNGNGNGEKTKPKTKRRKSWHNHSSKNNHNNNNKKQITKKNNLVISHSYSHHHSPQSKPTSLLPPPHPLSNVQSSPPTTATGTSPRRSPTRPKQKSHGHSINSNNSWASDAEYSTGDCASEATPIMSPARPHTFSFSSADTEEENELLDGGSIYDDDDELLDHSSFGEDDVDSVHDGGGAARGGKKMLEKLKLPSSPALKGIDISFTQEEYEASSSDTSIQITDLPRCGPRSCGDVDPPLQPQQYSPNNHNFRGDYCDFKGDTFFAAAHTRQFSSDDLFFEGIHNSGLQSLSFEQVADVDLNTSMEAEIELVYNSGSYDLSSDAANGGSVVSSSSAVSYTFEEEEGLPQSEEDRKEMEKRILQWRRGRHAMLVNGEAAKASPALVDQQEQEEVEEEEDEDDYDDVEMAPLTSSAHNSHTSSTIINHGHPNGTSHPNRYRDPRNIIDYLQQWRSPISFITKSIWRWHLLQPDDPRRDFLPLADDPQHYNMPTPRKSNTSPPTSTIPTFNNDGVEDEDDGDESKCLTSSSPTTGATRTAHSRQKSKHYDDVDFDRNANGFCKWCCKWCENDNHRYTDDSQPSTIRNIHSGWKKLLSLSSVFLLLAWVFSHGKLEKHHSKEDSYYPSYMFGDYQLQEDPLARDNFLEESRGIDDEDDYYTSNPMESPGDDDDHSVFLKNGHDQKQYYGSNSDANGDIDGNNHAETAAAASLANDYHQQPSEQYNKLVGIDTIVVLGSRHTGKDWLIDQLKRLYPNLNVVGEFTTINDDAPPKSRALLRSRAARVIDPISNKVIPHYRSVDGKEMLIDNDETQHRKSKSAHILVIAVFLNPYDWVELMRVDPNYHKNALPSSPGTGGTMDWDEFVEVEFPSLNRTVLELRAEEVRSAMIESSNRDGVKLVIPIQYEELVEPYSNYDNYVHYQSSDATSSTLPGIVGLVDKIEARTGLHPDESAGWKEPIQRSNPFWADPIGCTGHICVMSIHNMREDAGYIQYMNEHLDWEAEQLIGYQKRSVPKPIVDQIVILGERHSGAEWLVDRIARCFPNTPVKYGISRPGKWFQSQPTDEPIPKTLVISIFLNPYDWVELMRQHPINAPTHNDMEWSEFVTSTWMRKRSNLDNTLPDTTTAKCSFGFSFEEIIPCVTKRDPQSDSFPLYELHSASSSGGSSAGGNPYTNLLELRADKIRNFLSVAKFDGVVDFISMRYEDLLWDEDYTDDASYLTLPFPGIAGLLEKIRDQTSLVPDIDAGWISDEEGVFTAEALGVGATNLDPYYVQWMEEHVDWNVEMLVGYSP